MSTAAGGGSALRWRARGGVRVLGAAAAPGAAPPPPAVPRPPKLDTRARGAPAHAAVPLWRDAPRVGPPLRLGGGAARGRFCVVVSPFRAERTKTGVAQAGLWLIRPPWRANLRTSVGGYMKGKKKKNNSPCRGIGQQWSPPGGSCGSLPGQQKQSPISSFAAFARLPTAYRGASGRGERHPAPVLSEGQPTEARQWGAAEGAEATPPAPKVGLCGPLTDGQTCQQPPGGTRRLEKPSGADPPAGASSWGA